MNDVALGGLTVVVLFIAGLGIYISGQPSTPTREEKQRAETLDTLRRIEHGLRLKGGDAVPKDDGAEWSPTILTGNNREVVIRADVCGCIHCLTIFSPGRIRQWSDDGETAICPSCSRTAVVVGSETSPLTAVQLIAMHGQLINKQLTTDKEQSHETAC